MVGYTLVPPNMMANFSHFPVVDAFDCAHKRGDGQGIIAVRATKNANGRLVTIAFHDALGSESTLVCDAMARAEAKCFQASPSAIIDTSTADDSDVTRVSPCLPHLPTPLPAHRHETPRIAMPTHDRSATHRLNQAHRLAIQDGSASEAAAQKKWNPRANLFGCEFHHAEELIRHGKARAQDRRIYTAAMRRSKRNQHEVDLAMKQMTQRYGKTLAQKNRAETFPAFLPYGVGTHGMTTGNAAEVSHKIFAAPRKMSSLFGSMRASVEVIHRRDDLMRTEYVAAAASALGKQPFQISMSQKAPQDALPPDVHRHFREVCKVAQEMEPSKLHQPERAGDNPFFSIKCRGDTYIVSPSELLCQPFPAYDKACDCKSNGNRELVCPHVLRCVLDSKHDWRHYVKPYQLGESWRMQCLPVWSPPGASDALQGARDLKNEGQVTSKRVLIGGSVLSTLHVPSSAPPLLLNS